MAIPQRADRPSASRTTAATGIVPGDLVVIDPSFSFLALHADSPGVGRSTGYLVEGELAIVILRAIPPWNTERCHGSFVSRWNPSKEAIWLMTPNGELGWVDPKNLRAAAG